MKENIEETYTQIEEEKGDEPKILTPFDPKKVDISVEQATIEQLSERIKYEEIDLMPEFQRNGNLWDKARMSQLIESILIKLPLPAFYFDVANDNRWIVVDGLQRLSSIKKFMVNKSLKLKNLEFLDDLEEKGFDELDRSFQRRIRETNITIFKIKKGTPKKVLTSLFHRINTGGLSLTAQEIRHALNQGNVSEMLNNIADSDWFKACINVSPKRMLNKELIIRFMAFYRNGYETYKPSLQQFLDDEMEYLNDHATEEELSNLTNAFKKSLKLSKSIFNSKVFSKALIDEKKHIVINRSLFETTTVNFALLSDDEKIRLEDRKNDFLKEYRELISSNTFDTSITANTNNKDNVIYRHRELQTLISKFTDHAY
ncbi:MAG: DUF262 domain-containing protein [Marinifilaceae bacterium]|jgi:hypothetical protein|nr:DUF262 domain-containing protein [Marinifilaceae bacterium]